MRKRTLRFESGLTFPELIISVVVAVLVVILVTYLGSTTALVKGMQTQTLKHMKDLHFATQRIEEDDGVKGRTNGAWPGDTSFSQWADRLVEGQYLSTNELCMLLSAKGRITPSGGIPKTNDNAFLVYAVKQSSDGFAVFLSTANFTNTSTGGLPPGADAKPYGQKGFVIFHRAGDGVILANRQVGIAYTNIIGSYVPLCK